MDLGNVFSTVDAIRTAKLRQQLADNELAADQRAQQQEQDLQAARVGAWGGDKASIGKLVALAPQEATAIMDRFQGMADKQKADAAAKAKEEIDAMGRVAAWVKASPDPAAAYGKLRTSIAPEMAAKFPEQYDPQFIDYTLTRLMETDKVIDYAMGAQGQKAISAALAPKDAAPRGQQGAITPSPNPAGLDERIVGAVDSAAPLGAGLTQSESGGNFQAQNSVEGAGGTGHFGRGQFSRARLDDAKRAGVMPEWMTPEQFLQDEGTQVAVEKWHKGDIYGYINDTGLDRYLGSSINGTPVTEQGMLNVAHLGGKDGMRRFLESGGKYDPADANRTHLSDYLAMGARDAGSQPQVDPGVATLMSAAAGGGINDKQREVLLAAAQILQGPKLDVEDRYRNVGDNLVDLGAKGGPQKVDLGPQEPGFRQATPEEAAAYNAQAGQVDTKTGRFYPMNPPSAGVVVNTGDDPSGTGSFYKELDKNSGANLAKVLETAPQVMRTGQQIDLLDQALKAVPTGGTAALKQMVGEWGIATDGLSDIQAMQALINQMVPAQRAPGSGTMSDADLALFKASIPRVINTPGGNEKIVATMRAINQYDQQMVQIANAVANRQMTPAQGRDAMLQVPNPLDQGRQPTAQGAPQQPAQSGPVQVDGYTIEGLD